MAQITAGPRKKESPLPCPVSGGKRGDAVIVRAGAAAKPEIAGTHCEKLRFIAGPHKCFNRLVFQ
ncbi:MAG: hypothetical protein AMJ54_11600 [Deltaproteobacteria bacterium SG8_13]|nr:MAG: hypothetical protein AMJ54_11600 [Deltaproteobacteria bacterium SG8_13]